MTYRCIRCGKQFEATHKTAVCSECHTAVCVICGKQFQLQTPWTQKTCSPKCRGEYRKRSGISKEVTQKAAKTLLARYGVANTSRLQYFTKKCKACGKEFQTTSTRQEYCNDIHYGPCPVCGKLVEIKEMYTGPQACSEKCRMARIQSTCLERYGNSNAVNSEHARELSKQTCLEKYGVDHYSKSAEYRDKYRSTMLDRYGVTSPLKSDIILEKVRQTCLDRYGVDFNCMRPECRSAYHTISKINSEFEHKLSESGLHAEFEFPISRYSYDFKIGNILIEIDPSITHNTAISIFPDSKPLDKFYHINKTQRAQDSGYRCIHVWDWDSWEDIISLLLPVKTIYARTCKLCKVTRNDVVKFTNMYHISGSCKGQVINYGLYYNDELVEVMTFGKPRYNRKYDLELLRLCTKSGLRVIGGASKLFKAFLSDNPNSSVISYCDRSKFSGDVYEKIGMHLVRTTSPNKVWSKGTERVTQNLLNQRGFDQLFGTDYGKGTSNEQLMLDHGWLPVYDCGQLVFEYMPNL